MLVVLWYPGTQVTTALPWAIFKKDTFLPLGLRNNCRPTSCICLGGTSLLSSLKLQEAQVDASSSSKGRALGPGHQEDVSSNQDSSQLWEKCGAEASAQISG